MIIGKLKKTTSEKCPECGHPLQIRSKTTHSQQIDVGIVSEKEILYVCCSVCDYSDIYHPGTKKGKKKDKNKWR